jgi:hypothetical protein
MRYTLFFSYLMRAPGIYQISKCQYRQIADNRTRIGPCKDTCTVAKNKLMQAPTLYTKIFEEFAEKQPQKLSFRLSKIFVFILFLQLNSTLHYGIAYRMDLNLNSNAFTATIVSISNSVLTLTSTFFGITPHALYLHDHFQGYNHIIGLTFLDANNNEHWLPFINDEGRIVAPNWGRVHSMWANIAVTPKIDNFRLEKFIMKVTAFWGNKIGLDLNSTQFIIKLKKNNAPAKWIADLRNSNIQQPWINIGTVQWTGKMVNITIPDDINSL